MAQAAPDSASESAAGAVFPPKRGPGAWGVGRAAGRALTSCSKPGTTTRGSGRRRMVPAGAASHELRALACLSRISTSRGRTEDARDSARRFPPGIRAQRRATPRGSGGRAGKGVGEGGREMLLGPRAPLLGGGRKRSVGGSSSSGVLRGVPAAPGAPASRGQGERGGRPRAGGCGSGALMRGSRARLLPEELSAPGSPARLRGLLRPRSAEGRLGRVPCPLTSSCFAGEVAAGIGGGGWSP